MRVDDAAGDVWLTLPLDGDGAQRRLATRLLHGYICVRLIFQAGFLQPHVSRQLGKTKTNSSHVTVAPPLNPQRPERARRRVGCRLAERRIHLDPPPF